MKRLLYISLFLIFMQSLLSEQDKGIHTKILIFNKTGQKEVVQNSEKVSLVLGPDIKPEYTYFSYSSGKNDNEYVIELRTNEQLLKEISILRSTVDSLKNVRKQEERNANPDGTNGNYSNSKKLIVDSLRGRLPVPYYELASPMNVYSIFDLSNFRDYIDLLKKNISASKRTIDSNNRVVMKNQGNIESLKNELKKMNLSTSDLDKVNKYMLEIDSLMAYNNILMNHNKGLEKNRTLLEKELQNSENQYNSLLRVIVLLIITIGLIFTITIVLLRGYRQKKKFGAELSKVNSKLQTQNEQLIDLNDEKDSLLGIINTELHNAAEYVTSLIPKPINKNGIKTDWLFIPSEDLGGDSFGYNWIDNDNFAVYLLDVSGHGVGAALHSVQVLNVLQHKTLPNVDFTKPDEVMEALNAIFQMKDHNEMYFTLWYSVYNLSTQTLRYGSAGHPEMMIISENKNIQLLESQNIFIGAKKNFKFKYDELKISDTSNLYVFSDGVFEIHNPDRKLYSFEEFQSAVLKNIETEKQPLKSLYEQGIAYSGKKALVDDYTIIKVTFELHPLI